MGIFSRETAWTWDKTMGKWRKKRSWVACQKPPSIVQVNTLGLNSGNGLLVVETVFVFLRYKPPTCANGWVVGWKRNEVNDFGLGSKVNRAKSSAVGFRANYRANYLTVGVRANCGVNYSSVGTRAKKKLWKGEYSRWRKKKWRILYHATESRTCFKKNGINMVRYWETR